MRFFVVPAIAVAFAFGTGSFVFADEAATTAAEMRSDIGSMSSEMQGEMRAEHEQAQ